MFFIKKKKDGGSEGKEEKVKTETKEGNKVDKNI